MASLKKDLRLFSGQSLIEVVVALGIVLALATSLVTTGLITQRSSRAAKNNAQATKLAEQNIEQVRIFRDRNGFSALSDGSCFVIVASDPDPTNWSLSTTGCPDGETVTLDNTEFKRRLSITADGSSKKVIVVTVNWEDSGGTQTVESNTILADWCTGTIVPGAPCP